MVGIVYIQDIRYCPYLERYATALEAENIPYECIWWERWSETKPLPSYVERAAGRHIFGKHSEMARHPLSKLTDFAAFGRFASQIIKKQNYDKLIVLTTMSGMVLYNLLTSTYKDRYIFDIRDRSYEGVPPYRKLEADIIDASKFTCISSEGFLEFLPRERPYVISDNFLYNDIESARGIVFKKKPIGEPLHLAYLGFIRYFDENRKILDKLIDDERFVLDYHGLGADYDKLVDYQQKSGSKRLNVTGYFDLRVDKKALCESADIINNFYPHTLEIQRLATTNKAYDGMIYRRPQLVSKHTFSEKLVERWGIGCALDISDPKFADQLYDYYHSLNEKLFNHRAEAALVAVQKRDKLYSEKIKEFCRA